VITRKFLAQLLFGALGLGLLYWTITSFGVDNYKTIIFGASPFYLFLALLMPLIEGFSAGLQLWIVYKSTGINISLKDMFWINQWGRFISNFQKGVGIFAVIDSVTINSGISHVESTSRFGLYYSITMIVRGIATGIGLAYFLKIVPIGYQGIIMFCIALVFFGAIGLLLTVFGSNRIKTFIRSTLGNIPILGRIVNNMSQIVVTQPKTAIIIAFSFATLNWVLVSAQWYFIAQAIGYPIDFAFCLASISLLSIPKLIPILPSALGVYDFVMALGLGVANVPAVAGLSFAMLDRLTNIASNSIAVLQPQYLRFFNKKEKK
jgi:uncharacterized protein (TIRG00374 family)